MKNQETETSKPSREVRRRDFLKCAGTAAFVVGGKAYLSADGSLVGHLIRTQGRQGLPVSEGYLLVDTKKCQGCISCMLACSLVHEGVESPALSRIQVLQNSFLGWPHDLTIEACRQCVDPACVEACPTAALEANAGFGNVRMIDAAKCIGCGTCVEVCPYKPSRPLVAPDDDYGGDEKGRKCDLCANALYHWDEEGGGPNGKQACVEVCPVGAIQFTKTTPRQDGDAGYKVNLRGESWKKLGYPAT